MSFQSFPTTGNSNNNKKILTTWAWFFKNNSTLKFNVIKELSEMLHQYAFNYLTH